MKTDLYNFFLRLALAFGGFACIGLIIFWICNIDIAPDWDMVSVIHFLLGGLTNGTAPDLLSADALKFIDNEHRPVIPMFIWAMDLKFFDLRGYLPQALVLLFSIICAILASSWSQFRKERSLVTATITIYACILMLSPMHYENLVWPKQVHVLTATLMSILCFALSQAIPSAKGWPQTRRAALISALAFGASFSFAYGLVAWPVLLIHGAFTRWPGRAYAIVLLSAIITVGLYYSQYTVLAHHSDPRQTIFDPLSLYSYVAGFLTAPLGLKGEVARLLVGTALMLYVAWAAIRFYFIRRPLGPTQSMSLMICLFAGGIAFLTALGRVGINSGHDSRYLVIPAIFLLALPGLSGIRPLGQGRMTKSAVIVFVMVTLAVSTLPLKTAIHDLRNRQLMIREGAIAAALNTSAINRGLHPLPAIVNEIVWPFYSKLHQHEPPLEVFGWLGEPISALPIKVIPPTADSRCIGAVDSITVRDNNAEFSEVSGWARLGPNGERRSTWVLVTDEENVLVGLGTTGVTRPDVAQALNFSWFASRLTAADRAGFIGLVEAQPGEKLNFIAYQDGVSCLFARDVAVPEA